LDLIWTILHQIPSATVGLWLVLKFGLHWIYSFGDDVIFILPFWLEIAYSRPCLEVLGHISPNDVAHRSNLQEALPYAETHRLSHKRENRFSGSTWARSREKKDRTEQDS